MTVSTLQRRLLALCAVRGERAAIDWSLIAREALIPGGLD